MHICFFFPSFTQCCTVKYMLLSNIFHVWALSFGRVNLKSVMYDYCTLLLFGINYDNFDIYQNIKIYVCRWFGSKFNRKQKPLFVVNTRTHFAFVVSTSFSHISIYTSQEVVWLFYHCFIFLRFKRSVADEGFRVFFFLYFY